MLPAGAEERTAETPSAAAPPAGTSQPEVGGKAEPLAATAGAARAPAAAPAVEARGPSRKKTRARSHKSGKHK